MKKIIVGIMILVNLFFIGCTNSHIDNDNVAIGGKEHMYKFLVDDIKELDIKEVSIVGDFNGWDRAKNPLQKDKEGIWETELGLQPGEYLYQFVMNDELYLNDRRASLMGATEEGQLKSLIKINEQGEQLGLSKKFNINFSDYALCTEQNKFDKTQKQFNLGKDEAIYSNFTFTEVTGVHNLTLLWCKPDGTWDSIVEYPFFTPEGKENEPIIISSKLPLSGDVVAGDWKLYIFINGNLILKDAFTIIDAVDVAKAQELLPIGSVVLLTNSDKRLMIYGRLQRAITDGKVWDYIGCLFPEGNISSDKNFLFAHHQIQTVCFRGLEDEEEQKFKLTLAERTKKQVI